MAPARDIEKSLLTNLASGVAAGQIDETQTDATIARLGPAAGGGPRLQRQLAEPAACAPIARGARRAGREGSGPL